MKRLAKKVLSGLLWEHAQEQLTQHQPYVVAITGSVGKTSAKEAISLVLAQSGRPVIKTAGNLNTDIGLPLSLLGFEEAPADMMAWLQATKRSFAKVEKPAERPYYVLEFAADKPGDIAALAKRIPPHVAVMTSIHPVHLEAYGSFDKLVAEKHSLLDHLQPEGYAVLNAYDVQQHPLIARIPHQILYGFDAPAAANREGVWASKLQATPRGIACTLEFRLNRKIDGLSKQQTQKIELQTQVIGAHQLTALLAAAAVGLKEGVPVVKIKAALEQYTLPNGRGRIIEGQKGMTIIDDSYNASPAAVKAGLETLRSFAGKRRVVAVLGNMNELGTFAESAHREVARFAVGKVDYLVTVGEHGELMRQEAIKAGQPDMEVMSFSKPEDLLHQSDQVLRKGDVVYVKGSQNGVRLERLVKKIMAHPEQAERLLVRQSKYWQTGKA
jgi:UDP-N-acetylmuramyl pentapeptide synthase